MHMQLTKLAKGWVSMKSGLEGRNNWSSGIFECPRLLEVSMKSGLEGRNNGRGQASSRRDKAVSMKSGLEGRNNPMVLTCFVGWGCCVSMKSGLEGRNNVSASITL